MSRGLEGARQGQRELGREGDALKGSERVWRAGKVGEG